MASSRAKVTNTAARFGTIEGVFTPCTLTILGVIMFLRFGYCVGQAGVRHAIAIVLVSKAITALTALSLSAISTNARPEGGGAYYLISRSLGVEFGSAIGVGFSPMHSGGRPFPETMDLLSEGLHTVVFTHSQGGMELDV